MSLKTARTTRVLGAVVGAGALAASALVAAPAGAAATGLKYTCTDPLGQARAFTVDISTDAPASIEAGKSFTPKITSVVTVDAATHGLLYSTASARSLEGATKDGVSSSATYTVGTTAATAAATIPVTPVNDPNAGPLKVTATATGAAVTPAAAGALTITAGDFTAVLAGKDSAGQPTVLSPYALPCKLDAGQNAVISTVNVTAPVVAPPPVQPPAPVVKVASTTTVKAKGAKGKATISVTVKGADGKAGTGKVTITVKGKKSMKKSVTLSSSGTAKFVAKKLKAGKYKVSVAYAGSTTQNASSGKTTVKVK